MARPHRGRALTTDSPPVGALPAGTLPAGVRAAGARSARARSARALIVGALLAGALLQACSPGAEGPEDTAAPPTTEQAEEPAAGGREDESAGDVRVTVTATPHPVEGVDLAVDADGFRWAPENADGEPVPGEGHANVYVDGEHHGRLYASRLHLPLEPGTHEIRVTLNDSQDDPVLADGGPVEDTTAVTVPEREDHEHGHDDEDG
jgi:hypothetical protein